MSLPFYNLVHIFGIALVAVALGGVATHAMNHGTRKDNAARRFVSISHGLGLFLILLGGFGMLARLGLTAGLPGWIWAKLVIWVLLGALLVLPYRMRASARWLWVVVPALVLTAGWLAMYKPF